MPRATSLPEFYAPTAVGPALQYQLTPADHGLPASVVAGATANSLIVPSDGFALVAAGVTASQAGQLGLQLYLDAAGTLPQGAAVTAALTAGQPGLVNAG